EPTHRPEPRRRARLSRASCAAGEPRHDHPGRGIPCHGALGGPAAARCAAARGRVGAAARLAYYEALACMRGLVRTAEARLAPIGESGLNSLDASGFGEQLAARFARISGVMARLPAVTPLRRRQGPRTRGGIARVTAVLL